MPRGGFVFQIKSFYQRLQICLCTGHSTQYDLFTTVFEALTDRTVSLPRTSFLDQKARSRNLLVGRATSIKAWRYIRKHTRHDVD